MREYSTALQVPVPSTGNLTDDVVRNAAEAPDRVAFSRRTTEGWADVTARQFLDEVHSVAKGLVAAGIEAGDRVACSPAPGTSGRCSTTRSGSPAP